MKRLSLILMALVLFMVGCRADGGGETATATAGLAMDYDNALPVQSQLIVGTLKLADTDFPVDATEATALVPLWQAVQSLSQSDTTATVELDAVLKQIQETMRAEQLQAIADMQLTGADLQTTMQEAGIGFRPAGFGQGSDGQNSGPTGGRTGGGFAGGPPEGGFAGGPPGGTALTEDERATRVAERVGSGDAEQMNTFLGQAMLAGLIERLQVIAGIIDESQMTTLRTNDPSFGFLPLISETTGISVENLQTEMANGATPAEAITALGGDVDAVRAALIDAFNAQPNADMQNVEQRVDDFLNSSFARFGPPPETPTPTP